MMIRKILTMSTHLLTSKKQRSASYLSITDALSEAVTCDDEAQYCEEHEVIKPNHVHKWCKPEDAYVYDGQICRVFRVGSLQEAIDKHSNFFDDFNLSWFQEKTPRGYQLVFHNFKRSAFESKNFEDGKKTNLAEHIAASEDLDEL